MLSFSSIFIDTKNFVANRIKPILLILVILAIISQLIAVLLYPSESMVMPIKQMIGQSGDSGDALQILVQKINGLSENEKAAIATMAAQYLLQLACVYILTNLISISASLSTIYNLTYNQLTPLTLLQHIVRIMPQVILFMVLSIPYFFILSMISMMVPALAVFAILLGSLFYMAIYMLFLAMIIEPTNKSSSFAKIGNSMGLFKRNIRLVLPMIGLWFIATIALNMLIETMTIDHIAINIVINIINLMLSFVTICYFYRLYMLTNKA